MTVISVKRKRTYAEKFLLQNIFFEKVVYVSIPGKKLVKDNTKIMNILYWGEFRICYI